MTIQTRTEVLSAVARARSDLDRALVNLESLGVDDRKRVSYSAHAPSNYLMVVSTTLGLLRTKLAVRNDRDIKRWLDSLKNATNMMMSTARGVLTATHDLLPPLLFEPTSLTEIAEGMCQVYADLARGKRVRVVWRAPAERDRVVTDRVAVGVVLDNLLSNAVKYSSAGASVHVTTAVEVHEAVFRVRDHGPGLSETDQAKLFQRGMTLDAKPTAGESSTGFGLAIANDLAKALGGRLTCTSALGDGACFTFALPLEAGP